MSRNRPSFLLVAVIASGCALNRSGEFDASGSTSASSSTTQAASTASSSASTGSGGEGGAGGVGGGATTGPGAGGTGGDTPVDPWWDPSFQRRARLTFDNSGSSEDLIGFPVMVKLGPANFDYLAASASGADVRFVDADGQTELPFEIERWTEGGESYLWVRVPQVDAGSNTDHIWMYYANAAAVAPANSAQVWAGTHVGVYHLAEHPAGGIAEDSTSEGNHGAPVGMMGAVPEAGVIGTAFEFDGVDDYVALGGNHVPSFDLTLDGTRSIEAWVRSTTGDRMVISQEASCAGWGIELNTTGALTGRLFLAQNGCPASANYFVTSPIAYDDGLWHHVTLVIDRPGGMMSLYVDGALVASKDSIDATLPAEGYYDRIGTNYDNSRPFLGTIDEVRVSTVARSTAWIAAQYASMTQNFVSIGRTQTSP